MLIKGFSCNRFAGLKETDIRFEKGLNVILGPNESGKSTIVEGIYATLFKEPRLKMSAKDDKEFHERFMPHPDGDVIDSEIIICIEDEEYKLKKEWGVTESLQLVTPDGTVIKSVQTANNILKEILKFGSGTYGSIVFAKQRDIKRAINKILSEGTSSEVSNILIRTMMELDGISVDELDRKIQKEKESFLKRWDLDKNYPDNNRGINNPYKAGLGQVLESYYQKERIRLSMDAAQGTERDFEAVCKELKEKLEQVESLKSEKTELEKIEDDVTKRLILEPQINILKKEVDEITEVHKKWPKTEFSIKQLDAELGTLSEKIGAVEQEKENLCKTEKRSEIEKKLEQIDELNTKIKDTRLEIEGIKSVTDDDIKKLEDYDKEVSKIETTMDAGIIIGKFNRLSPSYDISLTTDLENKQKIKQGESFTAKGYIKFESDEFELELKTGELDYEELKTRHDEYKTKFENLLKDLQMENTEEAKLAMATRRMLAAEEDKMTEQVKLLLGDKKYEDLKTELEQLGDLGQVRDPEEIDREINELKEKELECKLDKKSKEDTLRGWIDKYESLDKALDLLVDKKLKLKDEENKLEKLAPLPEKFESAEDFRGYLISVRDSYEKQQGEYARLRDTYFEHQKNLPENTYEELAVAYSEAESAFDKKLRRAKKLIKIHKAFEKTKEEVGKAPFEPLAEEFTRYLCMLTDGNYDQARIDEEFNVSLQNKNGITMPYTLLSTGTYDCVALALRFSILKYIYGSAPGYVILDDCIVDLDPIRRKMAIKLIKQHAENNQIIFTTCNPEIAKSLGGNIIKL